MGSTGDFLVAWTDSGPSPDRRAGRLRQGRLRPAVRRLRRHAGSRLPGQHVRRRGTRARPRRRSTPPAISSSPGEAIDASYDGVFAQRFDASADKLGGELQVNTYTTGTQYGPDVAMIANGDFIVTWWGEARRITASPRSGSTRTGRAAEASSTSTRSFPAGESGLRRRQRRRPVRRRVEPPGRSRQHGHRRPDRRLPGRQADERR